MTFANPHWSWLLLGLPLVLLLFWLRGKEKRLFEQRYQRFLGFLPAPKLFVLQTLCFVLGLAAVIVSLARPRLGYTMMPVRAFAHELIFALDVSQSMLAEDIKPNRLQAAKRKIKDLTKALPGQKIGVVLFAGSAYTYLPVTADYEALHSFMEFAAPDLLTNQGSNYYAALRSALEALQQSSKDRSDASKTVILLSDGEQQRDVDFSRLIQEFKREHIRFYSLTIGTAVGAPIPDGEGGFKTYGGEVVISKADPQALASLAQQFAGQSFVYAADGSDVRSMVQSVKLHINSARQASLEDRRIWNETFQWFLVAGIGLLLIALLSEAYTKAVEALLVVLLVGATCIYKDHAWAADQRGITLKDHPTDQQKAEHLLDRLPHDALMQLLFNAGVEQLELALKQPPAAVSPGNSGNQPEQHPEGDPLKNAAQAFLAVTEKYESGASPKLWRDAMFNLGHALAHLKDIDQAIAVYQQLLKRFPEDGPARRNLEYLQRLAENQPEQSQQQPDQQQEQQQDQQKGQQDKQQQKQSSQGNGQDEDSKQQQADKPEQSEQEQQEEKESSQSQNKQSEDQSKSQQESDQDSDQDSGVESTQDEQRPDQKSGQEETMNSDEKEEGAANNHNQSEQRDNEEAQEERTDVARSMTDKPQEQTQKESIQERMTRGLLNLIPERVLPPGAMEQAPDQSQEETTRDW